MTELRKFSTVNVPVLRVHEGLCADTQCPVFFEQEISLFYYVCIAVLHTLVAGLLARSQYPEGPATDHLGTGFFWFPCV
jgi:hypothetical protein